MGLAHAVGSHAADCMQVLQVTVSSYTIRCIAAGACLQHVRNMHRLSRSACCSCHAASLTHGRGNLPASAERRAARSHGAQCECTFDYSVSPPPQQLLGDCCSMRRAHSNGLRNVPPQSTAEQQSRAASTNRCTVRSAAVHRPPRMVPCTTHNALSRRHISVPVAPSAIAGGRRGHELWVPLACMPAKRAVPVSH